MNLEGLEKFLFAAGKFELMIFAKREKRRQVLCIAFHCCYHSVYIYIYNIVNF